MAKLTTGMNKKARDIAAQTGIAIGAIRKGRSKKPTALTGDNWSKYRGGCVRCGYFNELLWTDASGGSRGDVLNTVLHSMMRSAAACGCEHLEPYLKAHTSSIMVEELHALQRLHKLTQEEERGPRKNNRTERHRSGQSSTRRSRARKAPQAS